MFSRKKKPELDDDGSEEDDTFDVGGDDAGSSDESVDSTQSASTTATTKSSSSASSSSSTESKTTKSSGKLSKKGKAASKKGGGGGKALYGTVRKAQRFSLKNLMRSRRVIAAETIQRYVRGFLWRRAEERRIAREERVAKERNIRAVRRRQMERDYWWDAEVDIDLLHRYQIEDLLMRLGVATSGTREQLLVRFKRWVLHRAIVADLGVQCATVAVERSLNGAGGVYAIDVPTPSRRDPPLLQLRQFQGKGYSKLDAGFASDSVYARNDQGHLFLLRGSDHYTDLSPPTQPGAHSKGGVKKPTTGAAGAADGDDDAEDRFGLGGGWLLSGRLLTILKKENVTGLGLGGYFTVCSTAVGEAFTWGLNPHGELASNAPLSMEGAQEPQTLVLLPPGEEVQSVAAGSYHGMAAMKSGRVYAWGCNNSNELGQQNSFTGDLRDCFFGSPVAVDSIGQRPIPRLVGHRRHIALISCGSSHSVACDNQGRVLTWGCRDGGRLGRHDTKWPAPEGDDVQEYNPMRRKEKPQGGAPPMELENLYEDDRMLCIDLACGAWHTLLLLVPRDVPWTHPDHAEEETAGFGPARKRKSFVGSRQSTPPSGANSSRVGSPNNGGAGGGGGAGNAMSEPRSSSKRGSRRKSMMMREPAIVDFGLGAGKRPGAVWSFGSGINGQLGAGEAHHAPVPTPVQGLPSIGILKVCAGTYVSACSDVHGGVWSWGSRGAGMFQPRPRITQLPAGQRSGGLADFACARDCLVFLTAGVAADFFEKMVELKIAGYREERKADEAKYTAKMAALQIEQGKRALAKGEAFMRGALARFRFARRAVKHYVSRKVIDDEGRKRRVYVNLKSGAVLLKRPYFLKAYGMEPVLEEYFLAATMVQRAARKRFAWREAQARARELYEEVFDPLGGKPYWYNPKTEASMWVKPRWLD